jgi:protein phosphatase
LLKVEWEAACETGCVRENNEDAWGAERLGSDNGCALLVVADGMGGHPGGDVASRLAVEGCFEALPDPVDCSKPRELIATLFESAHRKLQRRALDEPVLTQMGTTLTVLLIGPEGGWVGHIGDTRLLWMRGTTVGLVTRDHSAAWERVESGSLSPDEAENDPLGSLLTRHVGPLAPCEPDITETPLQIQSGDRLLLCSDGLGKVLPMGEIAALAAGRPLAEAVEQLVEKTLGGGGPDNVTVLLTEVMTTTESKTAGVPFESLRFRYSSSPPASH